MTTSSQGSKPGPRFLQKVGENSLLQLAKFTKNSQNLQKFRFTPPQRLKIESFSAKMITFALEMHDITYQ